MESLRKLMRPFTVTTKIQKSSQSCQSLRAFSPFQPTARADNEIAMKTSCPYSANRQPAFVRDASRQHPASKVPASVKLPNKPGTWSTPAISIIYRQFSRPFEATRHRSGKDYHSNLRTFQHNQYKSLTITSPAPKKSEIGRAHV